MAYNDPICSMVLDIKFSKLRQEPQLLEISTKLRQFLSNITVVVRHWIYLVNCRLILTDTNLSNKLVQDEEEGP